MQIHLMFLYVNRPIGILAARVSLFPSLPTIQFLVTYSCSVVSNEKQDGGKT